MCYFQRTRLMFFAIVLSIGTAAPAAINGDIIQVGFPSVGGSGQGRDVVRAWAWAPVIVDLTLEGQATFDGWIRVSQQDKDGDLCYDIQPVQLRPGSGGTRRYWLYTVINPRMRGINAVTVELISRDNTPVDLFSGGRSVRVLAPSEPPEVMSPQEYLILSVSSRAAGKVVQLVSPDNAGKFLEPIRIAHVDPAKLPVRWQGLEMVDAIIWDEADITELTSPQLEALVEWVRYGGTLVLAAGRTADTISSFELLDRIMPVDIGPAATADALPRFCDKLLGRTKEGAYRIPVTVAKCTTRKGAKTIVSERLGNAPTTLIASHRVERGRVVFVAASLRELFSEGGDSVLFFKQLLQFRMADLGFGIGEIHVFNELEGWIGFRQVGAAYVAVALLFALTYVAVGTFGSWEFLKRRGWLRHAWTSFGVVAIVASFVSVTGVQAGRGVGKKLAQLTVVDLGANQSAARATAYFGLKTSLHGLVDVWLPNDYPQITEPDLTHCVLKPLPTANQNPASYADPGRYRLIPSQAELRDVPVRGTLKQFEGRWSGSLPGRVTANIRLVRGPEVGEARIATVGSIVNELGVDLERCYLIYAAGDVARADSERWDDRVFVLPLGNLTDGQTYDEFDRFYMGPTGELMEFDDWKDQQTLGWFQEVWSRQFGLSVGRIIDRTEESVGLERHVAGLLLITTYGDYKPKMDKFGRTRGSPISAAQCRQLNMSKLLDERTALFVGFARTPGPVTLFSRSGRDDYKRVTANQALTVYRVLIPLG